MKITNAADYAIRAVVYMARNNNKKRFMRSVLSKQCEIPDSFLGKILQFLTKAEILKSERGKFGGYSLNKSTESITLYDIIKAIDGEIFINECLHNEEICNKTKQCSVKEVLNDVNNKFIDNLKNYSISNFIS
jgi:Rrf2 family protein